MFSVFEISLCIYCFDINIVPLTCQICNIWTFDLINLHFNRIIYILTLGQYDIIFIVIKQVNNIFCMMIFCKMIFYLNMMNIIYLLVKYFFYRFKNWICDPSLYFNFITYIKIILFI